MSNPIEPTQPSLGDALNTQAVAALDDARQMPPGSARAEAMNKAISLRNAAEMHQHFFRAESSSAGD